MNKITQLFFSCCAFFCLLACGSSEEPAYTISPPLKSIKPVYDTFEFDASETKMFRLASGSCVEIPADAFVDKNGNAVKGKIALKYREFHTASDILASGIPMLASDENGEAKPFESGGMFEITATANGEEINIASDKKVNVHMASKVEGDFDFYYLEEDAAKKVETASLFLQTQSAAPVDKQYRWKKIYSVSEDTLKNSASQRKKDPNAKYFKTHFDTKKYPEAAMLDTVKWEYAGISKTDDLTDASNLSFQYKVWSEATMAKPVYYTEKIMDIVRDKKHDQWRYSEITLLPDSLGFLAHDGENHLSYYAWDGTLKSRFKGVENVSGANSGEGGLNYYDFTFINKQHTHVLLSDENNTCKLFLMNGTLVKDLGILYNAAFDQTGNKIIGQVGSSNKGDISVSVFSLAGTMLHKIPVYVDLEQILPDYWKLSEDRSKIILIDTDKMMVVDMDGKTLAATDGIKGIQFWNSIKYNEVIEIKSEGNMLSIWDWKKNKIVKVNSEVGNFTSANSPTDPVIILYKDGKEVLWNWDKNTYKELISSSDSYGYYVSYSANGNFFYIHPTMYMNVDGQDNRKDAKAFLFNKEGVLLKILNKSRSYSCDFNEEEDRILIAGDTSELYLIDRSGKMIFDFKAFDAQIQSADFYFDDEIFTTTKNGTVMQWDKNGKLMHTMLTNKKNTRFYSATKGMVYGIRNSIQPTEKWDLNSGKSLYAYNYAYVYESDMFVYKKRIPHTIISRNIVVSFGWSPVVAATIWKNTSIKLPADAYHLTFRNDSIEFQTYVYLNSSQLQLMNQYQHALEARIKKEKKRESERVEEEDKLVRSFAINKFGIYNWDRFYKDSNAVCVKATMELDNSITEFNNISYFLITGKDRNVVVKYYDYSLEKFCFVPGDNNMLLAILPDERIAVFEEEKFRQLDIEAIKKQGSYTFKMKILDGAASKAVLDQVLRKPS